MQTRSFFNRKKITRLAQWLLELVYPLYGFASTPERRRYWRALPLRRAAKLFAAVFFVLAGVPFFIDALSHALLPANRVDSDLRRGRRIACPGHHL
jgi:hypothetical protein